VVVAAVTLKAQVAQVVVVLDQRQALQRLQLEQLILAAAVAELLVQVHHKTQAQLAVLESSSSVIQTHLKILLL
jgi:hypothetical protein